MRWAIRGGAEALGLGDQIGSLEAGKKADLILLDAASPTMAPIVDGVGILVYSAGGKDVDTVIVGGRVVMENRRLATADGAEIVRTAQQTAEGLWERAGRRPITIANEPRSAP